MTDIFISYSRSDHEWVAKLAKALESVGYSVWWDTQLLAGQDFQHTIPKVLEEAQCAIVVWSKVSIERQWVRAEAYRANERGVLVPLRIEQVRIPRPFNLLHAEDMQRWNGKPDDPVFRRLLGAITQYCPPPKPPMVDESIPKAKPDLPPPKPSRAAWWLAGVAVVAIGSGGYAYMNKQDAQAHVAVTPATKQPEPAPQPKPPPEPTPAEKISQARTWLESEDQSQWKQAVKPLQALADSGDGEAMRLLGFAYYSGRGVTADTAQGCQWYKQAANAGNTDAKETYAKLCQ